MMVNSKVTSTKQRRQMMRDIKSKFGVNCKGCADFSPNRTPSKLLPGARCKVDGYNDPRPFVDYSNFTNQELFNLLSCDLGVEVLK
jgi:hypothetical protein